MKHFLFDKWKAPVPKRFHSNSIIRTYSSVYIQIASRSLYIKLKTYFIVLTTIRSTIPHTIFINQSLEHCLSNFGCIFWHLGDLDSQKTYIFIFFQVVSFIVQVVLRAFLYSTYAAFIIHRQVSVDFRLHQMMGVCFGRLVGARRIFLLCISKFQSRKPNNC